MTPLGRPRSFDRQVALRQAMDVFWAVGYEAATLTDLQEAMGGITAPSFYAAFRSKEALFRETVELYSSTLGEPMLRALAEGRTARVSVEALLRSAARAFRKPGKPRGCMLVLAAMNSAPDNRGVAEFLRKLRARRRRAIEQRLRRAIKEGELPATLDAPALASFYATVIDGLAIQARDGASRKALEFAVQSAMNAWDAAIGQRNHQTKRARKSAKSPEA
jgi:AcrR family transcriptional regulator